MREHFEPLLGHWTGLEKLTDASSGATTTARASFVFKLDVEDTVVVQDYRRVRADGAEWYSHGVFLAEPGTGTVLWWLFDSTARPPVPAAGGWRDGALTLVATGAGGDQRHQLGAAADRLDYRIERRRGPGQGWTVALVGSYARISGH